MSLLTEYLDFEVNLDDHETELLPLFHNCSHKELITALRKQEIAGPMCNVFKEKIVYTFYGVSRYVSNKTFNELSGNKVTCCLILDAAKCTDVIRIFPFDTGALSKEDDLFRPPPIPWEELVESLDLGHFLSRINKLVLICYPDLQHYLTATFKMVNGTILIEGKYPFNPLIEDIEDLHTVMRDLTVADERRFSYEVQFGEILPLNPENVLGFVASDVTIEGMKNDIYFDRYRVNLQNGLFYPKKGLMANNTIGNAIKELTEDFTLTRFFS